MVPLLSPLSLSPFVSLQPVFLLLWPPRLPPLIQWQVTWCTQVVIPWCTLRPRPLLVTAASPSSTLFQQQGMPSHMTLVRGRLLRFLLTLWHHLVLFLNLFLFNCLYKFHQVLSSRSFSPRCPQWLLKFRCRQCSFTRYDSAQRSKVNPVTDIMLTFVCLLSRWWLVSQAAAATWLNYRSSVWMSTNQKTIDGTGHISTNTWFAHSARKVQTDFLFTFVLFMQRKPEQRLCYDAVQHTMSDETKCVYVWCERNRDINMFQIFKVPNTKTFLNGFMVIVVMMSSLTSQTTAGV